MSTGGRWRRIVAALPMRTALLAVAVVWVLGGVWSFQEQSEFASVKGFTFPHLLPLVIDGFAVSMAGVAWAASLDARPAVAARLATVVAAAASSASNGVWAWLRTSHDTTTVVLGIAVPVAANLAFEVLLAELRRQVQRRRGLPAPVALPSPRVIRMVLAPVDTFRTWRALVLDLTELSVAAVVTDSTSVDEAAVEETRPRTVALGSAVPASAELVTRARQLLAASPEPIGRRRLAKVLDVSEHQARQLLAVLPDQPAGTGVDTADCPALAVSTSLNGASHV
jgi:Protein of unknown function (DUF2637)